MASSTALDDRWEWLESKTDWKIYDQKVQKILKTEFNNGKPSAKFDVNGTQFEVTFNKMIQKNLKTNFERLIRYCIKSDDDDSYYCWQWQDDNKQWVSYQPKQTLELEENYNKNSSSNFTLLNSYKIDFKKMKQINSKTNYSRCIKRVKSECETEAKKTDDGDDNDESGPSRNLRKRKSIGAKNVDNEDDNKDENDVKRKKPLLKKTKSTSSASSKKSDKIKDDEEEEEEDEKENDKDDEVIEIKKEPENDEEKENEKKKTKKGQLKKETSDDANSDRMTRSNAKSVKKEEKDDDEGLEIRKSEAKHETNIKTVKFTGKIPVDEQCIEAIGNDYHIYIENGVAFDCMLNQTNLQFNNNKYYLLQLLEHNKTKTYCVWFRWGRVGKTGQSTYEKCGSDLEKAKNVFCRKFFDKTKNEWDDKDNFEKVPGKYDIVDKDYAAGDEDDDDNDKDEKKVKKEVKDEEEEKKPTVPPSTLDERIQKLIELICNVQDMENLLKEMKYDIKKAPLGKLSANQIKAGYAALKKIETYINENNFGKVFIDACNEFYTRIPHDFGMRVPTPIRTKAELKEKLTLLEALGDIEIAVKALNQKSDIENPIDRSYKQLDCNLKALDENDDRYKLISDYLHKTHAPTHCTYKMKILDIFEVHKQMEYDRFKDVGNKMLLWHGSRTTNWAGILSQGLKIAPPEAPVTGYMFGKGCYFADVSSKSANYCYTTKNKNISLISLSEVALGECNEIVHEDYNGDKLPENKSSTKGLGKSEPNRKQWIKIENDVTVPIGNIVATGVNNPKGYTLLYNEYVVYDVTQIKMKYLVKIEFQYE